MTPDDFAHYTDFEIVEFFRVASVRCAQCGFNADEANRISDGEMTPAYRALAARGADSLRQLLRLTDEPDPNVQADAAIYAYDADPIRCRDILKKLIGAPGWAGVAAMVWLSHKDADFLRELEDIGRLSPDGALRELNRRYPLSTKE